MVKVTPVDPERLARRMAATRAAYAANNERKDRVFGTAFEDVWWEQPTARKIKRVSTGDIFQPYDYNGGYPSFFTLKHGNQRLKAEYKTLYVDAHPYEPIVVIGPVLVYKKPTRRWSADELHLIASFFQTRHEINRKLNIARLRSTGHPQMADAMEKGPVSRVSVVFDDQGLISSSSRP
jgi:hypothetical protein